MTLVLIAVGLSGHSQTLPEALRYTEVAVSTQAKKMQDLRLETLQVSHLRLPQELALVWSAHGWMHYRLGNLDKAEKYVLAAWNLLQNYMAAGRLGEIYEKLGKNQAAIRAYAWALAAGGGAFEKSLPDLTWQFRIEIGGVHNSRERLLKLLGSSAKVDAAVDQARADLSRMRTVRLKPIVSKQATAEFFVLFSPGPKVEEVKFISGSEELRKATDTLLSAKFDVPFPDDRSTRIVRRGILMCHAGASGCEFVLLTPDTVHSLN